LFQAWTMQYTCTLVNIVLLLIVSIFYAFYCILDEFFAWMLDLYNDNDMHFMFLTCSNIGWSICLMTHSISMVCELASQLWLDLPEYNKYNTIQWRENSFGPFNRAVGWDSDSWWGLSLTEQNIEVYTRWGEYKWKNKTSKDGDLQKLYIINFVFQKKKII
jgi:hypothetical protein